LTIGSKVSVNRNTYRILPRTETPLLGFVEPVTAVNIPAAAASRSV